MIGGAAGGGVLFIIALIAFCCCARKRKEEEKGEIIEKMESTLSEFGNDWQSSEDSESDWNSFLNSDLNSVTVFKYFRVAMFDQKTGYVRANICLSPFFSWGICGFLKVIRNQIFLFLSVFFLIKQIGGVKKGNISRFVLQHRKKKEWLNKLLFQGRTTILPFNYLTSLRSQSTNNAGND